MRASSFSRGWLLFKTFTLLVKNSITTCFKINYEKVLYGRKSCIVKRIMNLNLFSWGKGKSYTISVQFPIILQGVLNEPGQSEENWQPTTPFVLPMVGYLKCNYSNLSLDPNACRTTIWNQGCALWYGTTPITICKYGNSWLITRLL